MARKSWHPDAMSAVQSAALLLGIFANYGALLAGFCAWASLAFYPRPSFYYALLFAGYSFWAFMAFQKEEDALDHGTSGNRFVRYVMERL